MRNTDEVQLLDAGEDLTVSCVNGKSKEAYTFINPCIGSDMGTSCTLQVFRLIRVTSHQQAQLKA